MEIFEEKTSLLKLEGIIPAELGFICYALEKALPDVKENDILHVDDGIEVPFYLPIKEAEALLEKIKKVYMRGEMRFTMNVDPEIVKVA